MRYNVVHIQADIRPISRSIDTGSEGGVGSLRVAGTIVELPSMTTSGGKP